jgi:hypothetical protein
MRYKEELPASEWSAGALRANMTETLQENGIYGAEKAIDSTWIHELKHYWAFQGWGKLGYELEIEELSAGQIFVSWTAFFLPYVDDDTDPMRMVRSAMAPGAGGMSPQDKRVLDFWWAEYLRQLNEQKLLPGMNEGTASPDESLEEEASQSRSEKDEVGSWRDITRVFAEEIDYLKKEGKFPDETEITPYKFSDLISKYKTELREAYYEACQMCGIDPFTGRLETGFEDKDTFSEKEESFKKDYLDLSNEDKDLLSDGLENSMEQKVSENGQEEDREVDEGEGGGEDEEGFFSGILYYDPQKIAINN